MGRIPHRNSEPTRHLERPPNFLPNMASSHVTDKSYQATPAEWSYRLNHSTNVSRLYLFQIFCFSTKKSSVFKFSYSFCTGKERKKEKKEEGCISVSFLVFSLWTFERSLKVRGGHENGDEALQISLTELIIFADFLDLNSSKM